MNLKISPEQVKTILKALDMAEESMNEYVQAYSLHAQNAVHEALNAIDESTGILLQLRSISALDELAEQAK